MYRIKVLFTGSLFLGALMFGVAAEADAGEFFEGKDGLAINGYDPVAYITLDRAKKGLEKYRYEWEDAEWRFISAENRKLFIENPRDYAPQYGGYCAYAAASGHAASTVPEAFDVHEGKLYLNYSLGIQRRWGRKREQYVESADARWPTLRKRLRGDDSDSSADSSTESSESDSTE